MSWKKTRHDKYYALAKEQGYRSRAAFKLIQINKKFDFLSKARSLLDLCAAPGGWLQVAQKFMPASSLIIGVDLLPIRAIRGVVCLKQDITTPQCRAAIKRESQGWDFDVVVHDGAPNVGGSTWAKDAYNQAALVIHSLKLTTEMLRQGGTFVTKIFRSQDYNKLLWVLNKLFEDVTITKPASSRNASAEIFAVCQGYLRPKKIDPRLLDPDHVFKDVEGGVVTKKVDVFHDKGKRNRSGYDDNTTLLYKEISAIKFMTAPVQEAIAMLGEYNKITFKDQDSRQLKERSATTEEVLECCKDLRVLGKKDFSGLLKWRLKVKKAYDDEQKAKQQAQAAGKDKPDDDHAQEGGDDDGKKELTLEDRVEMEKKKIDKEISAMREKLEKRAKKQKRRRREILLKTKKRIKSIQGLLDDDDIALGGDLFNLNNIADPTIMIDGDAEGKLLEDYEDDDEDEDDDDRRKSDDDDDEDEEDRYQRMMDDMDFAYEEYRKRRDIPALRRGRSSASKLRMEEDHIPGEDEFNLLADTRKYDPEVDDEGIGEGVNPLIRDIASEEAKQQDRLAVSGGRVSRWFGRDLFDDGDDDDDDRHRTSTTTIGKNPQIEGGSLMRMMPIDF
mmetsp:Transcript_18225/g.36765  ORF Transcript_18225/g.36765 Transcript_18225/m.36765 type:complete len:614 (-) Transcript_18225:2018-3859(-)